MDRRNVWFRVRGAVTAALLVVSLTTSCTVSEQQIAQQGDRIDDLQVRMLRLERAIEETRTPPEPPAPTVPPDMAGRLADLGQQVELVEVEIRSLLGRVDALEQQGSPRPAESARIGDLEARLTNLAEKVAVLEARALAPPTPATPTPQAPPTPSPPRFPTEPSAEERPAPQDLYDRAYGSYKQGRYEEAREDFREYVRLYPATKLTDNALFWIGESFYDQGQHEQAILEYDKVVQQFPDGDKVPSALLKQAFAFDAIGDPVDARILLRKILRDHPSSEQAAIARKKLEILGE